MLLVIKNLKDVMIKYEKREGEIGGFGIYNHNGRKDRYELIGFHPNYSNNLLPSGGMLYEVKSLDNSFNVVKLQSGMFTVDDKHNIRFYGRLTLLKRS